MIGRSAAAVALAALLWACGSEPPGPTPTVLALRTVPFTGSCRGIGLAAIVRGVAGDPGVAWLVSISDGRRFDVVFPDGDVAVFDPSVRILDASGRTVLSEGDYVDGSCVTGVDANALLLIPNPDDAFRLECGPIRRTDCAPLFDAVRFGSANWPRARIASFTFIDAFGRYTLILEDGRQIDGLAPPIRGQADAPE